MGSVPNPIIVDAAGTAGSGYVLKAYLPGETTSTSIAINSDGDSLQASVTANADGIWEVSGNEIVPHIDRKVKWGIFANAVDAAANTPFYMGPFDNILQGQEIGAPNSKLGPLTVAAMTADVRFSTADAGKSVPTTKEFSTGNSGGATYDIIAGTGTANGIDIIAHDTVSISFVVREVLPLDVRTYGINVSAADNQAATQQISDNQVTSVYFPPILPAGKYKYLTPVVWGYDVEIFGGGIGSIIDGTPGGFIGANVFRFEGAGTTALPALNANVSKGARTVVFASAPTLAIDEIFFITNPTNGSWSNFRTDYKQGEYCEVDSISGSTVTLKSPLYDSYVAANVNVFKQDSITPNIHDIKIDGDVSAGIVELEFCRGTRITNLYSNHLNNSIISGKNCYDTVVSNPNISNVGDGGDDYGILIFQSQHWRNIGGSAYARRHSVTIGGGVGTNIVVSRDVKSIGMTLKNDFDSNVFNADFHGHSEQNQYIDCTIFGGVTWQGKDNGYINCDIYEFGDEFVCIKGAEILGGRHYAENCRLHNFNDPFPGARGLVDVGGTSNAITVDTTEDVTFSLKGTTINGQSLSASTSIMMVRNRGSVNKINIDIDDLDLTNINNMGQVLFMDAISGTEDSDYIIIDNIKTALSGKKLGNISTNYKAFPMRMHELKGSEEVTTGTGSPTVTGTVVTFKFEYPEIPVVTISRSARGYAGNRIGIAYADPISTTGLTPRISTDDATNFSSAVTVTLNWSVGIKDI